MNLLGMSDYYCLAMRSFVVSIHIQASAHWFCYRFFFLILKIMLIRVHFIFLFENVSQMEEKVRELVEMRQRSLAEENQKTLEVLKERSLPPRHSFSIENVSYFKTYLLGFY